MCRLVPPTGTTLTLPAGRVTVRAVLAGGRLMKTSYRAGYGPPAALHVREVPIPEPGAGEILVRVHAATVNRTDCGALWGKPYVFRFFVGWPRPRVIATGTDFAGEVVAIGPGATRFAVGARVMGFDDNNLGSHAQYLCVSEQRAIAVIPDGVSFDIAAASMEGAHYARNFTDSVPLQPGDDVLVHGATGAIGSAAVALLKHAGARVTAICAEPQRAAVVALGADRVLDYTATPFVEQLKGETFAFVFDAVGKSSFAACRPLLRDAGVYLSSELGDWAQNPILALLAPLMSGPTVRFPIPADIPRTLALIAPLLARGTYTPLIDRRYTLDEIREAFSYVASGQKIGNVLLDLA
jgi:NADPH:quinone reductase-like Zn-dependent oxidoreductase